MKYIKIYEENNDLPEIGDYVICTTTKIDYTSLVKFLNSNIGQVIDANDTHAGDRISSYPGKDSVYFRHPVKYENVPKDLRTVFNEDNYRFIKKKEFLYHSKNREDLESILIANKFNL